MVTKFKKQEGKSIFQYFRIKQLELAKKKLETVPILVKSLADLYGCQSVSKFGTAFKHEFTPSEVYQEE
ncbi:MAG: AraC-like DNA-binding protein [Glaciecola sp.]|jgi:AraC-like DNA-binding protein